MATMKEVASLAGVSTATVSRALMSPEKVSIHTRKRVESAVIESGYTPNGLNRTVNHNDSRSIIVLLPNIHDPYYSEIIDGIQDTALAHGYLILLSSCPIRLGCDIDKLNLSLHKQADGLLILSSGISELFGEDAKNYPPIVMACDFDPDFELPTVHIDNLTTAFEAVNYLTQIGHVNIAQITGPSASMITQFRTQGYSQALRRSSILMQAEYNLEGDYSVESGRNLCKKLLLGPNPPTAIFCHNDMMAIGAMKQAKSMGYKVPEDLSVMGFDNVEFSQYCEPALTTVSQPRYDIGKQALLLLLDSIKGQDVPSGSRLLNADIVIRESVAPPRQNNKKD